MLAEPRLALSHTITVSTDPGSHTQLSHTSNLKHEPLQCFLPPLPGRMNFHCLFSDVSTAPDREGVWGIKAKASPTFQWNVSSQTGKAGTKKKMWQWTNYIRVFTHHILLQLCSSPWSIAIISCCNNKVYGLKISPAFLFLLLSPPGMLPAGQEWNRRTHAQWIQGWCWHLENCRMAMLEKKKTLSVCQRWFLHSIQRPLPDRKAPCFLWQRKLEH